MVMNEASECRLVLAQFFDSTKKNRARWFPIILDESSSSSSSGNPHEFGLNALLGIDYHDMFIPFMLKCGLLNTFKHNKTGEIIVVPSINNGHYNKSGYIWKDFLSEYKLDFIELAYRCTKSGKKNYYIRVGTFSGNNHFTISEQQRFDKERRSPRLAFSCRPQQKKFIASLARLAVDLSPPSPTFSTSALFNQSTDINNEASTLVDIDSSNPASSETAHESDIIDENIINFKTMLQVHLFDRIIKQDCDTDALWNVIDTKKLKDGLLKLVSAVQIHHAEQQLKTLQLIGVHEETIRLKRIKKKLSSLLLHTMAYHW
jgi:hypothetical protein